MESENNDLKRIFSGKDLAKLIFPLVIELMLTLLVGMIDSDLSDKRIPSWTCVWCNYAEGTLEC